MSNHPMLREAGALLKEAFDLAISFCRPGIARKEINEIVEKLLKKHHATSALKLQGFPGSMSVSVNYEIMNGIPDERVIKSGDLVSLDMAILHKGVFVDKATTFYIEKPDDEKFKLCRGTEVALQNARLVLRAGVSSSFVGSAISAAAHQFGLTPGRQFSGHRIGHLPHMLPLIPSYDNGSSDLLERGWAVAVEPILFSDLFFWITHQKQTISSSSLSAHFEETFIIHQEYAEAVTR